MTSHRLEKLGWEMQEPGWWTHARLGGLCREGGGWHWYPLDDRHGSWGPWPTAFRAAEVAADLTRKEPQP